MNLSVNSQSFFQVKAKANAAINSLIQNYLTHSDAAYASQYGIMIKDLREHPEQFKIDNAPKIPDGSPIGSDVCHFNSN